ncbi:MAG: molybdopterin-dependent oxidoreductase, partial [Candidatus Tectomicrobia bacterium]|nr:molybdopterin-dependent oxidoreductase [Candidatus Tectomicrobia bacterium]
VTQDEWVYSWCRQCALPPCGIKAHVRDGVAVKVEGDPQCPTNQGMLCSRGHSAIMTLYNPYRVKTPLKRTNPKKGLDQDPGWKEISWEEALDTISKELRRVRAEDPRKFVFNNGFARCGSMLEGMEFCAAFGTPNYVEVDGPTCSVHFGSSLVLGNFTGPRFDDRYTNYTILMGQGSTANGGYAAGTREIMDALERGMKLVVVDPRCSVEASKGEWIPIRPGSDMAFVLALQHVILYEIGRYDADFLKTRTNGPYLIGPDGHYVRHKASGKPLMWDVAAGKAKTFDDPTVQDVALEGEYTMSGVPCRPAFQIYRDAMAPYTPKWAEEKTSIPAVTIRRIAREFVDAARIGSTITLDGMAFPLRPACLQAGRGAITQYYGGNLHTAVVLVNMLVGALDVPGGGRGTTGPPHKSTPPPLALKPDADGVVAPKVEAVPRAFEFPPNQLDGKTYMPFSHDNPHVVYHAILHPDQYHIGYKPEVLMLWAGNPVLRMYRPEPVIDAMRTFKFVFALSYSFDEPTELADVVLPETTSLERWSCGGGAALIDTKAGPKNAVARLIARPVVKPLYDTRQVDEVFMELGRRIGILFGPGGINDLFNSGRYAPPRVQDPYKLALDRQYTPKEIVNLVVKSDFGPKADPEALRNKASCLVKYLPHKLFYPYTGFPAGKTRYPIYQDYLKRAGEELYANLKAAGATLPGWKLDAMIAHYQPVPVWLEPNRSAPAGYDLYAINWKTAQFSFGAGATLENPWLQEVSAQFDPYVLVVCLNRKTARARGLRDGDEVWVESMYGGKVRGKVKISDLFHTEAVGIAGNYGHISKQMNPGARVGIHFNTLMSTEPGDIDPISGGFDGAPKVRLYKA